MGAIMTEIYEYDFLQYNVDLTEERKRDMIVETLSTLREISPEFLWKRERFNKPYQIYSEIDDDLLITVRIFYDTRKYRASVILNDKDIISKKSRNSHKLFKKIKDEAIEFFKEKQKYFE